MRSKTALSPHGTALAQLGTAALKQPSFPRNLVQAARDSDLGEESLYLSWELTRQVQNATPEELEALLVTILASLANLKQGSTCLPVGGEQGEKYLRVLFDSLGAKPELADVALGLLRRVGAAGETYTGHEILGRPGDYKPLILERDVLYHQRLLDQENRVAESLSHRLAASPRAIDASQLETAMQIVLENPPVIGERPVQLSAEQQQAIRTAIGRSLTAISGGPGTGKTSVVVSILRALARLGIATESVALAAPTGKAANRMEESIRKGLVAIPNRGETDEEILQHLPEAKTLHRLLGYSSRMGGFRHHEKNPLDYEVVIVDEASMIDLDLMDRLLRAVPKDARLVLLGDADQLPSVDAGAVFRDLLPSLEGAPSDDPRNGASVVLTQSYRMDPTDPDGRTILMVAAHINTGHAKALFDPDSTEDGTIKERAAVEDLTFHGVELLLDGNKTHKKNAFLERWFTDRVCNHSRFKELTNRTYDFRDLEPEKSDKLALRELFKHANNHKILCVTTRDAEHVNSILHQKMASLNQRQVHNRTMATRFRPGEPIMMLRNDYERGLFNGDQGLVLRVLTESGRARITAVFPRKESFATYPLDSLGPDITLSYALTVHKSQGSEFDAVGLILPERQIPLLTREVLYTAVTRSRRSVVVLGTRDSLGVIGIREVQRASRIAAKL